MSSQTEKQATYSVSHVREVYDRAYAKPGLMGTNLDEEYSRVTKSKLLEMCQLNGEARLLDVGTGDGDLWQYASSDWSWHAVDISPVGVARAQQRFECLRGAAAIAENLPFPAASFDAVVAADTIEHVFDIDASLHEIRRVLVPDGRFALSVPTPNSLPRWAYNRFIGQRPSVTLFGKLLWTVFQRAVIFGNPTFQPIDRDLDIDQWRRLLSDAGYAIDDFVAWPEPPLKPIVYLIGTKLV